MKKEVSPIAIAVAVIIVLALIGGLYFKTLGRGTPNSPVNNPYGMPKPGEAFKTPPGSSGINSITGEPLPATARDTQSVFGAGMRPPAGMKVAPARPDSTTP